ncbi:MAG: hypothetical protein N2C12_13535, partial [Planctomycetales bacterium]
MSMAGINMAEFNMAEFSTARRHLFRRMFSTLVFSVVFCNAWHLGFAQAPDRAAKKAAAKAPAARPPKSKYTRIDVNSELKRHDRTVKNMLKERDVDQPKLLREYLLWVFFARMTDPNKLHEIPEIYNMLFDVYFKSCSSRPTTMKKLNDLTHEIMLTISRGPVTAKNARGKGVQVIKLRNKYYKLDGTEVPAQLVAQTTPPIKDFHPAVKYNAMLILGDLN